MIDEIGRMVLDTAERFLGDCCTPDTLRGWEQGGSVDDLWAEIVALGLADALLAEEGGDAAVGLPELGELAILCGRHLLPVPLADTIAARAILARGNVSIPEGPILLAPDPAAVWPLAVTAHHALVERDGALQLVALDPSRVTPVQRGGLSARLDLAGVESLIVPSPPAPLLALAASLRAAETVGMLGRIFELALAHAGERQQFGKPIGSFQAVQQQLAVLAEEHAAAAMAVSFAFGLPGHLDMMRAGIAKLRADAAAGKGLAIAHAVIGAIGVSEEFALRLFARRLIDTRLCAGGEAYWAVEIGRRRLKAGATGTLDFIRQTGAAG